MMSTSTRKRKCSSSDQVDKSKRMVLDLPDRACCNCSNTIKVFDYRPPNLPFCIDCSHKLCLDCPIQSPLLETLSVYEESRAQELQPQPTGRQKEVETRVTSRRSLNMNKCERCRLDKKKCLPVDRVWPTKCDLCIKKGFPCSESKRVVRSTKHAPTTTPSSMNATSPSTTSTSFEERLTQWAFFMSYRNMMIAAKNRLERLEEILQLPFSSEEFGSSMPPEALYHDFFFFVNVYIDDIYHRYPKELLTMDPASHDLPGWFLITSLNQLEPQIRPDFACYDCYHANSRSKASVFESSQDVCGELSCVQHRIAFHSKVELWQAHVHLSQKVSNRASMIFDSYNLPQAAEWAKILGVYHPDELALIIPGHAEYSYDCLRRSQLHLSMDEEGYEHIVGFLFEPESGFDMSKLKDSQDILGRTALLIACQHGWEEDVECLLEAEADPGLTTIYGSLPLHYAAAEDWIDICTLLLFHKGRFDIKAVDSAGKTALDYAREKEHQDVVKLLSAAYAAANGEDEELSRASSLQAGI